jgi:RHS repeat-associated protein
VYAQGSQPAMLHGERGYTGHEQLNQFGLINMNARLYDPLLGRFLAPDAQVSAPETSNGYNRYMYASDNPMMFVDLNGEESGYPDDGYTGGSWNGSGGSGSGQSSMGYNQNTGSSNSSSGLYSPGRGYTGGAYPDLSGGFGGYSAGNSDSGLGGFIIGVFESLYNLFSGGGSRHSSPPHPVMKLSSHPIIKTHGAFPASIGSSGGSSGGVNKRESSIQWFSQYDPSVPNSGPSACKRACYMMDPFALRGMSNGYFVGKVLGHSFITTNQTMKGYKYLNQQLLQNRPVIVGIGRHAAHYWGNNTNGDFTTDHFVVIDNPTNGGYHFLDPGSHYEASGNSRNNIFRFDSNGLYTGQSYGKPMTITWIG